MYKNKLIIYLFLLYYFINYIKGAPTHTILNSDQLNKVPSDSISDSCDFDILVLIEDKQDTNSFGQLTSSDYAPLKNKAINSISKNETHALYNPILRGVDQDQLPITLVIKRGSIADYTFQIQVFCKDINPSLIKYSLLSQFKPLDQYYQSLWNISGIEYPTLDTISYTEDNQFFLPAFKKVTNEIYTLTIQHPPKESDQDYWIIYLCFYNSNLSSIDNVQFKFANPFKYYNDDFISAFKYYPNYSPSINIGFYSTPIYSFKYNNPNEALHPFFTLKDNYNNTYESALPISGKLGDVNYLGSTFQGYIDPVTSTFQFNVYSNGLLKLINETLISYQTIKFRKSVAAQIAYFCSLDECYFRYDITNTSKTPMTMFQTIIQDSTFAVWNQLVIDYPFGYTKGNSNSFEYSFSITRNPSTFISFSLYTESSPRGTTSSPAKVIKSDSSPPILNSISFQLIRDRTFLITLNITETVLDDTGLEAIYIGQFKEIIDYKVYRNETLANDGTHQIIYDFMETNLNSYQFILIDSYDNRNIIKNQMTYGLNSIGLNSLNIQEYYLNDLNLNNLIKNIKVSFLINNLNTTNSMYNNQVYMELDNIDNYLENNIPIIFEFSKSRNSKDIYYLKYNSSLNQWSTKFRVPANLMEGSVSYKIYPSWVNNIEIPSSALSGDCQLNVTSNYFDYMGPLVTNIERIPIDKQSALTNIFGWYITVSDQVNGFMNGYITVRGDLDNSIYNFTLDSSNNILDTIYISKFKIEISIPSTCKSMDYIITEIYLQDTQGQYTTFSNYKPKGIKYPQLNSLLNYMDRPNDLIYSIPCSTNALSNETSVPQIIKWTTDTTTIDITSDTKFSVDFEVYDVNGLKIDQLPVLYLIGYGFQIIQTQCINYYSTNTNFNYSCEIIIPYQFGYLKDQSLSLSIYGLISNNGNFNGYSRYELNNLNFNSKLDLILSNYINKQVKLVSITYDGGLNQLILYGSNLGSVVGISISDNSQMKSILYQLPINTSNSDDYEIQDRYIIYSSVRLSENSLLYVRVVNQNNEYSNIISFSSIQTSLSGELPIKEKPTSCDLDCGQPTRGYCSSTIQKSCICYSPWIGLNCNSQVVTVPQPDIDQEKPDSVIDISDLKSLISVVSIRELNFVTLEPEFSYQFDKWTFKNISESKYQYTSDIKSTDGNTTSNINVTLEWFKVETNITFANEQLLINPSTMKYTIRLSSYPFKNKLNSLQLVLMSQIERTSTNDIICSSKEFGDINNLELSSTTNNYLKIQVGDRSLYSRYIKRAISDNTPIIIKNQLLDSYLNATSSSNKVQSFIGITVPNYKEFTLLDPDWSVLIDSQRANSNSNNSICSNQKKSLSPSQLAGIIIGSVAFFIVIILLIIKVIYSSPRFLNVKIFFYRLFKK